MTRLALVSVIDEAQGSETCMPPLGLGYIAAYLRKYSGFGPNDIAIYTNNILHSLERYKPDVVGISSVTQNFTKSTELGGAIKMKFGVPIIAGGPHISALPHTLPKCFDVAVLGEGEDTFRELMDLFAANDGGFTPKKLEKVNGIAYRDGGRASITKHRAPIAPLDRIPFPARDLLKVESKTQMLTSRGCPYRCVFCSSSVFWDTTRFFTARYVVDEIRELSEKYAVKMINFYDDLFIADIKRLREISKLIRREGLHEKIKFACNCRANMMTDEICELLSSMNTKYVSFGFESGSDRVLSYLKQGNVTVEQNARAIRLCTKHGINVCGTFVLGAPGETRADMIKTLDFIKGNPLSGESYAFVLAPYPGTKIWDYALKKGLVSEDMDWGLLDIRADPKKSILLDEEIDRDEFYRLYGQIQNELRRRRMNDKLLYIKKGIKHPDKLIKFLYSKLKKT